MGLTLVSGTISMLRERTTVTGDAHSVSTRQSTEFRIGDRPATLAAACNLTIGDKVTAAGHAKAELTVLALRNDTTNVVYSIAPTPLWSIGFMVLSIVIALVGWSLARRRYASNRDAALAWEPGVPGFRLLHNKYFVDEIYAKTVVAAFMQLRVFLGQFDKWVIDGLVNASGVAMRVVAWVVGKVDEIVVDGLINALSEGTLEAGSRLRRVQTGRIQSYIYGILTGGVVLALVSYIVR